MNANPLLDFSGLPRYGSIRPEHVAPGIDRLLAENRALIARLTGTSNAPTWNDFVNHPDYDALWQAFWQYQEMVVQPLQMLRLLKIHLYRMMNIQLILVLLIYLVSQAVNH